MSANHTTSASDAFESADGLVKRLRSLRKTRRAQKKKPQNQNARKKLLPAERDAIFEKTGGRCHICGGPIEGEWVADHVYAHSLGGPHKVDNYLPAHALCNQYRWFYGPEEFQWILKLGVWVRTEIEKQETEVGRSVAAAFCSHDRGRANRRVSRNK